MYNVHIRYIFSYFCDLKNVVRHTMSFFLAFLEVRKLQKDYT